MRQTPYVPHLHLQVASCFQDVDSLVVGDDDEALAVHLQDLLTHLEHKTGAMKVQDTFAWLGSHDPEVPLTVGHLWVFRIQPEFFRLGPEEISAGWC